jgi:hypothetical protein
MPEKEKEKGKATRAAAPPAEESKAPSRRRLPIKAALILGAVMVIEFLILGSVFVLMGGPADVKADPAKADLEATAEQPVEEFVIADKYPNTKRGRTYLYDTEIYVVVKRKSQDKVKELIKSMTAQISADVRTVIGRAEPNQLLEPTLATIKRQVKAVLDERLGMDEDGRPRVQEVVITKFTQFRAE